MPLNLEDLKKLLVNPEEALLNAAKKKNINEALVILVLNSILISVALGISLKDYSLIPGVLVAGIIGVLFSAFLLQVAFSIIGGKGKYVDALISLTYPFFGFSLSFLIVSLISFYSSYASIIAGVILFLVYWIVSLVGMVRVLKESYKLDIITVWITVSLVMLAAALTIYTIAILALPGSFLTSSPLYPYR